MVRNKMKVLIALSISCSMMLSQIAMADSSYVTTSTSESRVVTSESVTVQIGQEQQQADIVTKISKDEAIKIVKSFKFAEGYEISNISLQNNNGSNQPTWRMDLNTSLANISASISANTGELLNYYTWQQQNSRKYIVTLDKKAARELADKFLAENIKSETKSLEYIPNQYNTYERTGGIYEVPQYNFTYALKVNGIITSNANYNISINASNGKVTNFSSPYEYIEEVKYPSTEGIKDLEQLKNKYISLLEMQLQYITTYDNNKLKVNLTYLPVTPGLLNAKTMDTVNDYIYYANGLSQTIKAAPINPDAKVENKEITEEKALEVIKNAKAYIENIVGLKFEDNQNTSVRMNTTDKEFSRNYNFMADNKNYGLSITLNLNTGNITGFNFYQYFTGNYDNGKNQKEVLEKVSYIDAKKVSDEIVKNLFIKQYGVYSDNNKKPDSSKEYVKLQPNHEFQYTRFENGIFTSNTISVSIDKETGKPYQIYMNWNDLNFPKANVISAEAAKDAYVKGAQFALQYYSPYIYNSKGSIDKTGDSVIVFAPNNNTMNKYINAETGKIIDYSGRQIEAQFIDEKHWAANNIELLEVQGVVISNLTNYDEKLSRQNAVKMLSLIMGIQFYPNGELSKKDSFSDINKENEYYKYVESAVANDIIRATGESFNGIQNITKQEYIVMLIDMLGYSEIAKSNELFSNSTNNSTIQTYISICKALDILPIKTGDTFNANDTITFAEAAYSLQKSLKYFR